MGGTLSASVGKNGVNNSKDVTKVQILLNIHITNNSAYRAKIKEKLVVNGKCGPDTIAAIEEFQRIVLKWKTPDSRVDANARSTTWKALNGNVPSTNHIVKKRTNGKYTVYDQLKYKKVYTGNSTSSTISRTGCTLTVLTMAATAIGSRNEKWPANLLPKDLTPVTANEILKSSNAFVGGDMIIGKGATALGMNFKEYGRNVVLSSQDINVIIAHLNKGYPVAAHVDYKRGAKGDHWILLTRYNTDGSFSAVDPLFGGEIKLIKSATNNARANKNPALKKNGIIFGSKDNQDKNAGPLTQKGQQNYIVVRFGLLSPMVTEIGMCMAVDALPKSTPLISGFSLITAGSASYFDIY